MKNINKAAKLIAKCASEYIPTRYCHTVTKGIHKDRMEETGGDDYCEKCIQAAIDDAHSNFFERRTLELGKLYDVILRGKHTFSTWAQKGNTLTHRITKDSKHHGKITDQVIKKQIAHIKRTYPVTMKFSETYYDTYGSESEGFSNCAGCGEMFAYSLLLNEQELGHWEEMKAEEIDITSPYTCYQLEIILGYWALDTKHPYYKRINELALKIISTIKK